MSFITNLQQTTANDSYTENGALGYKTSGSTLVDINFSIPAYRRDKEKLREDIRRALDEHDPYLLKYLFYARDIRGGLGERDFFRVAFDELLKNYRVDGLKELIALVPEYGRFDDWCFLLDSKVSGMVVSLIAKQLSKDEKNMKENKPISILAKWLPSDNATSIEHRRYANIIARGLRLRTKDYRAKLVKLRKYLDVVEVKACSNKWNKIDYNKVSSNANVRYARAFMKHDAKRRMEWLNSFNTLCCCDGAPVMHSETNFPHDIVAKYKRNEESRWHSKVEYDEAYEQLWKNLAQMDGLTNTLVVRDGSGSMTCRINRTTEALDVADALSIYCSERCDGEFKNKFITFSSTPELVDLSSCESLAEKLNVLYKYDDCSNTDLKRTFGLILRTALEHQLTQEELPSQILIVSDMEFDAGIDCTCSLMDEIREMFESQGYKLPKLVFWNVNSRTNTLPLTENEFGFLLVSGFSVQILEMVNSGELSPRKALISILDRDRYNTIPLLSWN